MLSNRLWGGLQIVGGVLEMVGAGALCAVPEPLASKVACIAFGVHGSDTAAAGLRQVWTARDTATLTYQGAAKLAEVLGVGPQMADHVGLSIDMTVPFGFAGSVKAVRASRIAIGRIDLDMHEAKAGSAIGGHTLRKHVGKSEAWLRERLVREPKRTFVSSFASRQAAEEAISKVMQDNTVRIAGWAKSSHGTARLELIGEAAKGSGYGISRDTGKLIEMNKVQVFLRREPYNGMPYYIITAYLTP